MEARLASFISSRRVARLATADASGRPHVVPICYVFDGDSLYSAIDLKPKRVGPRQLKRVRNVLDNPQVAVIVDDYSEDWSALAYVLIRGAAEIMDEGQDRQRAEDMLRDKYPQYRDLLPQGAVILKITPDSVTGWGRVK
jgi:PPOX class probable F420-dependent enzyme